MTRESIPGTLAVTMDLPKVLHGITFERHATIEVNHDVERVRIDIVSGAKSVKMTMDYGTLASVLNLLAQTLEHAAVEANHRRRLAEAIAKLGMVMAADQ